MKDKRCIVSDFVNQTRALYGDIRRTIGRIKRVEDMLEVHGVVPENGGLARQTANDGALPRHVVELIGYWDDLQRLLIGYRHAEERAVFVIEGVEEPHWRAAVSLYVLDGYTLARIGRELHCSASTAGRWVRCGFGVIEERYARRLDEFKENQNKMP